MEQRKTWTGKARSHLLIPDTQCKKGVPLNHLTAAGNYIAEHKPNVIINIGDHFDMPSLSSYDKGTKSFEGRRYRDDIDAGNAGLDLLMAPINKMNAARNRRGLPPDNPEEHVPLGQHEDR